MNTSKTWTRRLLSLFALTVLLFTFFTSTALTAHTADADWKALYKKELLDDIYRQNWNYSSSGQGLYIHGCTLVDVDKDGIPELFTALYSRNEASYFWSRSAGYTIVDGKVE